MKYPFFLSLFSSILFFASAAEAQFVYPGANPEDAQSIIQKPDMYRTSVWRRIDLTNHVNKSFFAAENEITKVIRQGVETGKIKAYFPNPGPAFEDFSYPMPAEEFSRRLRYHSRDFDTEIVLRDREVSIIELREDLIFDRNRSKIYWDIHTLTLVIPRGRTPQTEIADLRLANFDFNELYDYFNELYHQSKQVGTPEALRAYWYNPRNPGYHLSLASALELRLFESKIFRVAQPVDPQVADIVREEWKDDPKEAERILKNSQRNKYHLVEFEHLLWNF